MVASFWITPVLFLVTKRSLYSPIIYEKASIIAHVVTPLLYYLHIHHCIVHQQSLPSLYHLQRWRGNQNTGKTQLIELRVKKLKIHSLSPGKKCYKYLETLSLYICSL
jgi:hypothetical protein